MWFWWWLTHVLLTDGRRVARAGRRVQPGFAGAALVGAHLSFLQARLRLKGAGHRSRGQRPRTTNPNGPRPVRAGHGAGSTRWEWRSGPPFQGVATPGHAARGRCPRLRWSGLRPGGRGRGADPRSAPMRPPPSSPWVCRKVRCAHPPLAGHPLVNQRLAVRRQRGDLGFDG
jgi:hypothetical protein